MQSLEDEMDEGAVYAMDRVTVNHKVISRRQEYSSELERVIGEAKLTIYLLSQVNDNTKVGDKILPPEEVIAYYNGIFLDQVHQIKDKLFRMIDRILLVPEEALESQKKDPDKVKTQPFLNRHESKLKEIGIYDLLQQWSTGSLKTALNKRTQHHHFVSTIRLNQDFQKIKTSRIMLDPLKPMTLSEYGKEKMAELGRESFNKWNTETTLKLQSVLEEIEENINQVAKRLVTSFKIPTSSEEIAGVGNRYMSFLSSFDIENHASSQKITPRLKDFIYDNVKIGKEMFGTDLVSVYLVGSCARNEFIPGSSDINMYFIVGEQGNMSRTFNNHPLLNFTILTVEAFLSEEHKKDRFICWSDGIVLFGNEFKFNKNDFPKPGTYLTLLLNKGFIEQIEKIKKEVAVLENPNAKDLQPYYIKAARIIMDFDFGVAMANKPYYTASRQGKIEYTKESWPEHKRTIVVEQLYKNIATIRQEDFPDLVEVFLTNSIPNYQKMMEKEIEAE